jgi:hypothetical protein
MAARLNKLHQEDIRQKIQASQLINVLQDHALTADSELSPSRIKAIEILLRKSVADLSAITVSGDPDNPLGHTVSLSAETQQLLQQMSPGPSDPGVPPASSD